MAETNVIPGKNTSEFFITKLTVWFGIAVAVFGGVEQILATLRTTFPAWGWVGAATTVVGTLTALFKAFGYTQARAAVKVAASNAAAAQAYAATPDEAAANVAGA